MREGVCRALGLLALLSCACPHDAPPSRARQPIVNGQLHSGHPSVGMLGNSSGTEFFCTATLVGCRTVLTAAHCVYVGDQVTGDPIPCSTPQEIWPPETFCDTKRGVLLRSKVSFLMNCPQLANCTPPSPNDLYVSAGAPTVHPGYAPGEATLWANDLAVVRLEKQPSVAPSAISSATPTVGAALTLVGFGFTDYTSFDYGSKRIATNTISMVDAVEYTFEGATSPDGNICGGDSGGPGFTTQGGLEVLIGVNSYSNMTQDDAGVLHCGYDGHQARLDVFFIKQASGGDVHVDAAGSCGGPPTPPTGSCVGFCGGSTDSCWCDDQCSQYGDCCPDFQQVCGAGTDTQPPYVSISSPGVGSVFTAGVGGRASVPVQAVLTDNVIVTKAPIYLDGKFYTFLDLATSAPTPVLVPIGQHTIQVEARDGAGNAGYGSVSVSVVPAAGSATDAQPPYVTIIAPASGATVAANAPLIVTVRATDDVKVDTVYVRVDGEPATSLSGQGSELYNFKVVLKPGSRELQASAYDASGKGDTASIIVIADASLTPSAPADSQPPTVSIVSPADGTRVPVDVTVTADVTDDTGIERVLLFVDGAATPATTLPASGTQRYELKTRLQVGERRLRVAAYDLFGNVAQVSFLVVADATAAPGSEQPIEVKGAGCSLPAARYRGGLLPLILLLFFAYWRSRK